jgi:hypothetical protein
MAPSRDLACILFTKLKLNKGQRDACRWTAVQTNNSRKPRKMSQLRAHRKFESQPPLHDLLRHRGRFLPTVTTSEGRLP